jgi:hypothetical protein
MTMSITAQGKTHRHSLLIVLHPIDKTLTYGLDVTPSHLKLEANMKELDKLNKVQVVALIMELSVKKDQSNEESSE